LIRSFETTTVVVTSQIKRSPFQLPDNGPEIAALGTCGHRLNARSSRRETRVPDTSSPKRIA